MIIYYHFGYIVKRNCICVQRGVFRNALIVRLNCIISRLRSVEWLLLPLNCVVLNHLVAVNGEKLVPNLCRIFAILFSIANPKCQVIRIESIRNELDEHLFGHVGVKSGKKVESFMNDDFEQSPMT